VAGPVLTGRTLGLAVLVGRAVLALAVDALLTEVDLAVLVLLALRIRRRLAAGAEEQRREQEGERRETREEWSHRS
jgi:hypothetical protein